MNCRCRSRALGLTGAPGKWVDRGRLLSGRSTRGGNAPDGRNHLARWTNPERPLWSVERRPADVRFRKASTAGGALKRTPSDVQCRDASTAASHRTKLRDGDPHDRTGRVRAVRPAVEPSPRRERRQIVAASGHPRAARSATIAARHSKP